MKKKHMDIALVVLLGALILALSVWCWVKPAGDYSDSERRVLAGFPKLSAETVLNGKFMTEFEKYTLDQFPLRDSFRTLKAVSMFGVFGRLDNNDIYIEDGYVSKLESPLNEAMVENAAQKFAGIYDKYLAGTEVNAYVSIIPDKNYFLAEQNGYPSLDYARLEQMTVGALDGKMEYIDIFPLLEIGDYYRTDTHWKQESIRDVADALANAMGADTLSEYRVKELETPFYGVYCGQSALPIDPDAIFYLTNSVIDGCTVTNYDTGMPVLSEMYDMEAAFGRDPYEMFVCGSSAFVVIENPAAENDRELVIFRDSFGSSIAPYFCEGYSKISLVDIRYMPSEMVGKFIDFDSQDVLFLYSTLVLNNSSMLK